MEIISIRQPLFPLSRLRQLCTKRERVQAMNQHQVKGLPSGTESPARLENTQLVVVPVCGYAVLFLQCSVAYVVKQGR